MMAYFFIIYHFKMFLVKTTRTNSFTDCTIKIFLIYIQNSLIDGFKSASYALILNSQLGYFYRYFIYKFVLFYGSLFNLRTLYDIMFNVILLTNV